MNSKQVIMQALTEITDMFPKEMDQPMFLERVTEKTLDEFVARSLITYAPIYLPLFERDGDLFALHIKANGDIYDSPVLKLFHDVEYPLYLSTSIKTFPYAMFDGIMNFYRYYDEIIDYLKLILDKYNLPTPDKSYYDQVKDDYYRIIDDYDKNNKIMQILNKTSSVRKNNILPIIQEMYDNDPDKLFLLCLMLVKSRLDIDFDKNILFEYMKHEYSYSFGIVRWYYDIHTGLGLLEAIKQNCLSLITPENPFFLVKDIPFTDPKVIDKLLEVATIFSKQGDDITALNQVRNACTVAGAYGRGLTKDLCKTLAEYTKKVEPDGLAYHLANFAVDVIDLGP